MCFSEYILYLNQEFVKKKKKKENSPSEKQQVLWNAQIATGV